MTQTTLSDLRKRKLIDLLGVLIDQEAASVWIEPNCRASGYWFGGGNGVRDEDGTLWIAGRYRNFGDSRTGLAAGERGLECALFASTDNGATFTKERSWSKADLSFPGNEVLSIEGTSLHRCQDGSWELFVSSEKAREYPPGFEEFRKPGAGVWTIDVMTGEDISGLDAGTIRTALAEQEDCAYLHVKDPVVYDAPEGGTHLVYCSHPFCWSSANTGLAVRPDGQSRFERKSRQLVCRGPAWDVAGTRLTCRMPVPALGVFADLPPVYVFFYDGLECVREHEQNNRGVSRPRGYSCEELGGAMAGFEADFPRMERLSYLEPLFVSPWGTGASRYIDALVTAEGIFAIWEQSQPDLSQPLVGRFVSMREVKEILS